MTIVLTVRKVKPEDTYSVHKMLLSIELLLMTLAGYDATVETKED